MSMGCAKALHTKTARHASLRLSLERAPIGKRVARLFGAVAFVTLLAGCAGSGIFAPISSLSDRGVDGTYRVQPGDTLSSISRETGVSVERLIALNDISNPSLIRTGQRLRLSDDAVVPSNMMADSGSASDASGSMGMDRGDSDAAPAQSQASTSQPSRVTPAADASKIAMVWPAKGKVIQRFTDRKSVV